jgi:hypothetical protein
MGQNPDAADNQWLRDAYENRIPIIYFLGIAPGRYQAMLPTFISGWDGGALNARVAFGVPDQGTLTPPETALERRYALHAVKQRLHQASFREAVIAASRSRLFDSPLIRVTRSPELHRYRAWIAACDERNTGLRLSLSRYRVIGVIGGKVESASLGDKRALRLNRRVSPS